GVFRVEVFSGAASASGDRDRSSKHTNRGPGARGVALHPEVAQEAGGVAWGLLGPPKRSRDRAREAFPLVVVEVAQEPFSDDHGAPAALELLCEPDLEVGSEH